MRRFITTFRYVLIAAIMLLLIALAWWYFFLRSQEKTLSAQDAGRGTGTLAPSFGGGTGSTYSNIQQSQAQRDAGATAAATKDVSVLPQLFEINKTPVAGAGFVGMGTSSRVRFVERGTGYVLELDPQTGVLTRLTNTLVPRVYEATVAANGNVALRGLDENGDTLTTIGTVVEPLLASSSPGTLSQKLLPDGIRSLAFSPIGDRVLYIAETPEGKATGIVVQSDGSKPKELFASSIAGWQAIWLSDGRIILTQNSADGVGGYAYEVKSDGVWLPLLRNISGLTILPRSSEAAGGGGPRASSPALLFSGSNGGVSALMAQLDQKTTEVALPIRTIADKCVWSPMGQLVAFCAVPQRPPSANFLNLSHRGAEHTEDAWWRVDVSAGTATLLYSPGNISIDVEDPKIDDRGAYITFVNTVDKSLWLLRVDQ